MDKFYITTPIYYTNDVPHIGHAYTTVAADVAARFHRLAGRDVFFLTGTDEHGIKNLRAAQERGLTPQAWVDAIAGEFRNLWDFLNISYDDFIRTTEPRHKAVAARIFQQLYDQGDIYLGTYEGWYCPACETFYPDTEQGPGRTCLVHTGRPLEWTAEESYLFRLSKYQDWLLSDVTARPEAIEPETARNEVVAFAQSGLRDIAVSRSTFAWGVPVPFDPRHVIYVWIDALTNYISALGYLDDPEKFRRYWPADVHLVGRDIVRFHAVIWPIILHAAGIEVPRRTFAHGFLTFGAQRFSKTLGIVIDPKALSLEIAAESGAEVGVAVDALRYFLLREIPFGADGDFNKPALVQRFNADLANDYGNLLNRTLPLVHRYFEGRIPARGPEEGRDTLLRETARSAVGALDGAIEALDFRGALGQIWQLLGVANRYLDEEAPWRALRDDRAGRAGTILYNTLEALRVSTIALSPWLPTATQRVWEQLGVPVALGDQHLDDARRWGDLPAGTRVREGAPIFPRIETRVPVPVSVGRPTGPPRASQDHVAAGDGAGSRHDVARHPSHRREDGMGQDTLESGGDKPAITLDEFRRLDLRVGQIRSAARIAGTDKLIEIEVDIGGGEARRMVTGIFPLYQPEELIGRRIIVLANLQPRRVRGVESKGMLLAAEWEGEIGLLGVDKTPPPGSRIT